MSLQQVRTEALIDELCARTDGVQTFMKDCPTEKLLEVLRDRGVLGVEIQTAPSTLLLRVLASRGGHPGALAEAALLCIKKSEDYNQGQTQDPHNVDRSGYFPFGVASYAQMLHTKAQRFNSLTRKQLSGEAPNFEGLRDTALDIINYAGFFVADKEACK